MVTPDGRRITSPASYKTREDAERILDAARFQFSKGAVEPETRVTLDGFAQGWLARRRCANAVTEKNLWRNHITGTTLAGRPLQILNRKDLRAWLEQLSRKRALRAARGRRATPGLLSAQTATHCFALVRKCLSEAVEEGYLSANPALGMRLSLERDATRETWTYLTDTEIAALIQCDQIPPLEKAAFIVGIFTGLRQGELWGLHWADVDLGDSAQLTVRFSYRGPTKGRKIRYVPLLGPAKQTLIEWRKLCPRTAEDLVFPSATGLMRRKGDNANWQSFRIREGNAYVHHPGYRQLAGIKRDVRFHDLRHTCASHLSMGTWGRAWRIEEIRDFLGHSDIKTTQRYAHLSPDHLRRAVRETHDPTSIPEIVLSPGAASGSTELPKQNRPNLVDVCARRKIADGGLIHRVRFRL